MSARRELVGGRSRGCAGNLCQFTYTCCHKAIPLTPTPFPPGHEFPVTFTHVEPPT